MASLTKQTIFAANWRACGVFAKFVLQGISTIWLTRMLSVEAFGVYSEIWVCVAFVQLVADLGLSSALIQKKEIGEKEIGTAMTFTAIWGTGLTVIVVGLGYILSGPEKFQVVLLTAPTIVLAGLCSTGSASLSRNLDFKSIMWIETLSILAGPCLVAILLGLAGFEAKALAAGILAQFGLRAALFLRLARTSGFFLNRLELKELLRFGRPMTVARLANYCALNGDYFVVGRTLGSYFLGLYSRAYTLMSLPVMETTSILTTVLFPAYSRLQGDEVRLKAAFFRAVRLVTFLMIPMSLGMAVTAEELVVCLFGAKWRAAVEPFAILCCGGWLRSISNLSDALARSKGEVKAQSARHVVYASMVITGAYIGSRWGLAGVATGVFIGIAVMAWLMGGLALRILKSRWSELLVGIAPGVMAATINIVLCGAILPILRESGWPPLARLMASASIQALVLGIIFAKMHRKLLTDHERAILREMIRKLLPRATGV